MAVDLSKLRHLVEKEVEEANSRNRGDYSSYPIMYPGENGKITVRLLYCEKFGGVQRKLTRHTAEKNKVPCMQMFGEDCPICKEVSTAETLKGKDCGAFRKYGWKTRGICYAVIDSLDATYSKKNNAPKRGDVVVLMYPQMVYTAINNILCNAGDNLENLLLHNDGIPIIIERTQQGSQPPKYNTSVFPYGPSSMYQPDATGTGEEKWERVMASLPDLGEEIISSVPTEEIRASVRAFAEVVKQEYVKDSVVNPTPTTANTQATSTPRVDVDITSTNTPAQSVAPSSVCQSCSSGKACFGHHVEDKNECLTCLEEDLCIKATKGTA